MGSLVFQATLGGQVNLNGPNTASTFDIAVPATTGTMVTTGDSGTVTNTMLAASAYNTPGTIGSGTANSGAFTTLSASSTVSGTGFSTYLASPPAIGGTTAAAGAFTTLSASSTVSGTGFSTYLASPPAIGGTAPAAGTFTSVSVANTFSSASTFGFKNRIINGAMVIDQRNVGASQTFTAAAALAYAVDRWYGYCTGANVTGQQIAGGTTPTVTQNRYRFTGAASVTAVGFGQRIEQKNSYDLAGSTCTLSADLAISATLTTVTWTAYYATTTADTFGSLASPTVTQIATGTFTVSSTVTNFSTNISIPAAATTGIQILFTVGALTAGLTWTIGNVQLEKGSTATSFDYRSIGTELQLCQRYLPSYKANASGEHIAVGQNISTTQGYAVFPLNVTPRVPPTGVTVSAAGDFYMMGLAGGNNQCSALAFQNGSYVSASLLASVGSALQVAGNGMILQTYTTNAKLLFTGCEL